MPNTEAYQREDGSVPFEDWFESLKPRAAAKVRSAVARMEDGNFGDHKGVGKGVIERRIDFEKGYRIYFGKDGDDLVLLLLGGSKTRQNNDVRWAQELWAEYKARKKKLAAEQESIGDMPKSKRRKK